MKKAPIEAALVHEKAYGRGAGWLRVGSALAAEKALLGDDKAVLTVAWPSEYFSSSAHRRASNQ